jgi:hypothetical protein
LRKELLALGNTFADGAFLRKSRLFTELSRRMPMPKCKLIALTTPLPGKEDEYHDWYQNTHLPELVNLFNMEGAQRFELVAKLMGADANPYLAIYDIDTDDPAALLGQMGEAAQSGKMTPATTQDMATTYTALFIEHGPRVEPSA